MNRVNVRIDGLMVLTVLAIAGGVYVYSKSDEIKAALKGAVNKVNPAHQDNFVNQAVESVAIEGGHNGYSYDDHLFGAIDLINPWNKNDDYAEKVWGLQ